MKTYIIFQDDGITGPGMYSLKKETFREVLEEVACFYQDEEDELSDEELLAAVRECNEDGSSMTYIFCVEDDTQVL